MSLTPMYFWDSSQFENPELYIPQSLEQGYEVLGLLRNSNIEYKKNAKYFLLGKFFQDMIKTDDFGDDVQVAYHSVLADLDDQLADSKNRYASIDKKPNTQGWEIEILRQIAQKLGLIMFDPMGVLFLPNGQVFPEDFAETLKESAGMVKVGIPEIKIFDYLDLEQLKAEIKLLNPVKGLMFGGKALEDYHKNNLLSEFRTSRDGRHLATLIGTDIIVQAQNKIDGIIIFYQANQKKSKFSFRRLLGL